jgi:hypothetical protein
VDGEKQIKGKLTDRQVAVPRCAHNAPTQSSESVESAWLASRLASLVPASDSDDDPVSLVTLGRVAAGSLRLVSWRLHKTLVYGPVGSTPIGIVTKP